eukprot:COSAG01_NODE_22568_length_850_cov_1.271638_1_plen_128_part_01
MSAGVDTVPMLCNPERSTPSHVQLLRSHWVPPAGGGGGGGGGGRGGCATAARLNSKHASALIGAGTIVLLPGSTTLRSDSPWPAACRQPPAQQRPTRYQADSPAAATAVQLEIDYLPLQRQAASAEAG